jgi:hypothetical protein
MAQVVSVATQYHNVWFLGTWLQATGSLLSVVFFLALVQGAGETARLAGLLTSLGSAVLLAVVLIEGVFTLDLAQAAVNGHQVTSLTSFDIMTVFTYIYPIVPAPVIFLAFGLGIAFAVVGLVALFTTPILTIVVLSLQALWVLAAAITLLVQAGTAFDATAEGEYQHEPAV